MRRWLANADPAWLADMEVVATDLAESFGLGCPRISITLAASPTRSMSSGSPTAAVGADAPGARRAGPRAQRRVRHRGRPVRVEPRRQGPRLQQLPAGYWWPTVEEVFGTSDNRLLRHLGFRYLRNAAIPHSLHSGVGVDVETAAAWAGNTPQVIYESYASASGTSDALNLQHLQDNKPR